jgi:predicted HicB family RNase H-like nuclease
MSTMTYKGYTARVEYDERDHLLVGRVLDLADSISFEATTVEELEREFSRSIDDYLALCKDKGREPAKPFSGKFQVRMAPEEHRRVAVAAERAGKSMNEWITETLRRAVDPAPGSKRGRAA